MAYGDFYQLNAFVTQEQDQRFYSVDYEDPSIKTEFEGGYVATRPRHKRAALRRTFSTGWTDMTTAEKENLQAFYGLVSTASIFVWVNPWESYSVPYGQVAGDTFVRFTKGLSFTPKPFGATLLWDCEVEMQEV